nr:hypothetical protein [Tanacetum cinerariifolium]
MLRRSRQETHISQHGGFGIDEGTGSKPEVPDVPSNDSEEEISWNSSKDEETDTQEQDRHDDEEIAKIDVHDDTKRGRDEDEESENDEESDDEKLGRRRVLILSLELLKTLRIMEIGRGLQVSQDIKDSYVTLTPVHPDGQQKSSSVSSQFVTSMLNSTSDVGMESIFTTASSSVAPLPTPIPTMTPSIITTITTASHPPIPPTPIPIQIQTDPLRDSYQRENDEFLRTINDNMKRIIKEQVKSQVKDQVSRILPRIEQSMNAQLEYEVLTRSSHSSRTSYAVTADISEMELKKILIEKIEGNQSIQRSDEQRNLYKALVEAYEADKIILDTYGERVILKKRRDDDDDQGKGPSTRSDRRLKRQREGKEPESARAALEPTTRSAGRSTEEPSHPVFETDHLDLINPEGQHYPHNLLQPIPLIPDNRGRRVIPFAHFINNDLEYLRGGASSRKYTTSVTKTKAADYGNIKWIEDLVPRDFKRLRLQDIEDMLLLLVQGKLSNLTIEERFAFNVSLRMFTRSIVIQRHVEDLQLGVESYQKRLNLTKPDAYRSDLNDGTLNDVCNALDDRLKGIRMQYLPQTIWRKGDKDRATAMIQAIDKMLKTRRIMISLERFVGGRLYEGDFQMLQRTI